MLQNTYLNWLRKCCVIPDRTKKDYYTSGDLAHLGLRFFSGVNFWHIKVGLQLRLFALKTMMYYIDGQYGKIKSYKKVH